MKSVIRCNQTYISWFDSVPTENKFWFYFNELLQYLDNFIFRNYSSYWNWENNNKK